MAKTTKPALTGRHRSASPYESLVGFSRAVRRGTHIAVSGTAPIDADGETVAGGAYEQATRCFEVILEAVLALGGTREDVVRTRMFVTDASDWDAVGRAHGEFFGEVYPAATLVVVKGLLDPRWRVEIEADAEVVT
ncbi:MAG: RidA family protein [Acidobacteriota bacterium]|nr:RidA family protein [Acidobacteriota bacterium]